MITVIAVLVTLAIAGIVIATVFGSYSSFLGWGMWSPNLGGVLLAGASLMGLAVIGLMKLGAWIW